MKIKEYEMPEDLYYEANHYWVKNEDGLLVMGMDDFGQKMAGEIVYVQLPPKGKTLKMGKSFAKMESGKWVGKVPAPVNGELVEVNEKLEARPKIINEDCYGQGWMYRIKPQDLGELENLIYGAEAISKWIEKDIIKYST